MKSMNAKLGALVAVCMAITAISNGMAQTDEAVKTPASSWERYSQGVASVMMLAVLKDNGHTKNAATIYIKNISTHIKEFVDREPDHGLYLFYMNSAGKATALHSIEPKKGIVQRLIPPVPIMPNHVLERTIDLTAAELVKVKSSPIQCEFRIYDPSTYQAYTIQSTPRMMIPEP